MFVYSVSQWLDATTVFITKQALDNGEPYSEVVSLNISQDATQSEEHLIRIAHIAKTACWDIVSGHSRLFQSICKIEQTAWGQMYVLALHGDHPPRQLLPQPMYTITHVRTFTKNRVPYLLFTVDNKVKRAEGGITM